MFVAIASQNLLILIFALSVYPLGSAGFSIRPPWLYSDGVVRQKVVVNDLLGGASGWDVCVGGRGTDINSVLRFRDVQRLSSCLQ